jgi:hypothetical protein
LLLKLASLLAVLVRSMADTTTGQIVWCYILVELRIDILWSHSGKEFVRRIEAVWAAGDG